MIKVKMLRAEFLPDFRALISAFYPGVFLFTEIEEAVEFPQKLNKEQEKEAMEWELNIMLSDRSLMIYETGFEERGLGCTLNAEGRGRKNQAKKLLYNFLSYRTGKSLPWGTMTGVRPTKLVLEMIMMGDPEETIRETLSTDYLVSEEKIDLAIKIAKKEAEMLLPLSKEPGYSLYVGVPFCPTTCAYCSFPSFPEENYRGRISEYTDCLIKELEILKDSLKGRDLHTIYFGGGTPTTLSPGDLDRLISYIKDHFDLSKLLEWTVEAGRPDSITREKLQVLKKHGIDRISVNPQTMKQKTLDLIGRHHSVEDTVKAMELARELGFKVINMDLILGLPGETNADLKETLEAIKRLKPENLTLHSLAMKRNSRLSREGYKNDYGDGSFAAKLSADAAREMGLSPYYMYRQKQMNGHQENVGYSLPGKEGIYNIIIMEEWETIYAVGAGAISKIVAIPGGEVSRIPNVKDVDYYMDHIDEMIDRKKEAMSLNNRR